LACRLQPLSEDTMALLF